MAERVLLGAPFTAAETGLHVVCIRNRHGAIVWDVTAAESQEDPDHCFGLQAGQVVHAVTLDDHGDPVGVDGVWAGDEDRPEGVAGWALSLRHRDANSHADLACLLRRARRLQTRPPEQPRLERAVHEAALTLDDVRWVHAAAELVDAVVRELEPGALRSPADLPDEPPLFTTRRLFAAVEKRLARVESALGMADDAEVRHHQGPWTLPVTPFDLSAVPQPWLEPPRRLHEPLRTAPRRDPYEHLSDAARLFAGLPPRPAERPETSVPDSSVKAHAQWFDENGCLIDSEQRETVRGPQLHTMLAAWSDRPHAVTITIEADDA